MDSDTYRTIHEFVSHNQYRARLFRIKPIGAHSIQITVFSIQNKGLKAFDEIKDTQLPPIDINAPKNSFEKGVIQAYNSCRQTYLNKYLGFLTDHEIEGLLRNSQLKKNDVLEVVRH